MRLGFTRDASVQAQNLTIKLQQDVRECHAPFCQMGARPERVRDASEMCANVTLELSCTVVKYLHFLLRPMDATEPKKRKKITVLKLIVLFLHKAISKSHSNMNHYEGTPVTRQQLIWHNGHTVKLRIKKAHMLAQ